MIHVQVLSGEVPFIGAYCNGEIGPVVSGGYAGWALSGMAQSERTGRGSAQSERTGRGSQGSVRVGSRIVMQSEPILQGYTTMMAAIS